MKTILLLLIAILSVLFSLLKGSTYISFQQIYEAYNHPESLSHTILFSIRLPETLCAFTTGSLLALAGALMQILLRNPLADPYVLGVSSGAAVVTLLLMFFGVTGVTLIFGAWLGSLLAIFLVLFLSYKKLTYHSEHLILTGIALASGFSALISLILFLSPDHVMRSMLFWLVGDLSETHLPYFEILILFLGLMLSLTFAGELNILARGEKEALALGVNVRRLKIILFLLSSALTATAVTLAGCIGFIGLIVPHMLRFLVGYDHRILLPNCVLLGGTLLTFADTLSRIVLAPLMIPVGIMMTLIGIPVFLILLQKN